MSDSSSQTQSVGCFGFGSIVAVILSVALNQSTWWGIFHFLCGWFYVLHVLICRSHEVLPALQRMFS